MSSERKVALVTGASRGVGKGIALALAKGGVFVYLTGRTTEDGASAAKLPGSIHSTASEIRELGGQCQAIACDHTDDAQVQAVFAQIHAHHGQLDLLVNNVWGGYQHFTDGTEFWQEAGFWTEPLPRWDSMFQSGVRAHYVSSVLAAKSMVSASRGLIINISFHAAQRDDKGVAYATAKAATDRMTSSMAFELGQHNVTVLSLYPGMVRTESVMAGAEHLDLSNSESPEFVGRAVQALLADPRVHQRTGSVVKTAELATEYGFTDVDGSRPKPFTF